MNRSDEPSDVAGDDEWPSPRRLADGRIIGGVAAGLSAWLGVPTVAVRLVFVVAALLNGIGLLAYAAFWLALPADTEPRPQRLRVVAGAALGAIAVLLILERFDLPRSGILLPLLLIGIGVALWQHGPNRPPRFPARWDSGERRDRTAVVPHVAVSDPVSTVATTTTGDATSRVRRVHRPRLPARAPRSRSPLARIGLALAIGALAIALLGDRGDVFDLTLSRGASLLLVVLGAALIVGARYGHARSLTFVALPVALFLPVASTFDTLDVDLFTHLGDRSYFVDGTTTALEPTYRNGMGKLELNLANIVRDGVSRRTELRNGMGTIEVVAPPRVEVTVRARAGWGTITVDDLQRESVTSGRSRLVRLAEEAGRDVERTFSLPGEPGAGSLEIDAAIGFGTIRVTRLSVDGIDRVPFGTPPVPTTPPAPTIPPASTTPPAATTETR